MDQSSWGPMGRSGSQSCSTKQVSVSFKKNTSTQDPSTSQNSLAVQSKSDSQENMKKAKKQPELWVATSIPSTNQRQINRSRLIH